MLKESRVIYCYTPESRKYNTRFLAKIGSYPPQKKIAVRYRQIRYRQILTNKLLAKADDFRTIEVVC